MTTATRPSYWSLFLQFTLFLLGPLGVELLIYLIRPEIYPSYLPFGRRFLTITLVFVYFSFLLFLLAAILALIQRILTKPKFLIVLVSFIFLLFYAISLSRLVPFESGFSLFRILIFVVTLVISFLFGFCLNKWPVAILRLWIGITVYSAIAAFLLQHLFRLPFPFVLIFVLYPALALGLIYFPGKLLIGIAVFIGIFFFQTKTLLQPFAPPLKLSAYDRVILVGIDAFSPDTVQELRTQKRLAAIDTLFSDGVHGRLTTLSVPFSPLVWNTIYTGAAPKHHGVMGFTFTGVAGTQPFLSLWLDNWTNSDWSHQSIKLLKKAGVVRTLSPANARSRRLSPLWDLVSANGGSALVVGGWTTYPPEKIHGTLISDYAFAAKPGTIGVYHPIQKQVDELLTYQPSTDGWPEDMKRYISRDLKVHNLAMNLLKNNEQRNKFVFAYYSSPDAFGHHYGTRIGMNNTSQQSRKQYLQWRNNVYQMMDSFLQDFLTLMDDRTLLIVCSDHGFNYDKRQHNYAVDGLVMMFGKGVRKNLEIRGDVYAIAPTVLYALGMPRSNIFSGMPLKNAFEGSIPEPAARSYSYKPEFLEAAGQDELDEDKLRELEQLQYINR
jgi:predicted AlkP superfamily pyrophosphatase or phosphodiesterase